MHCDEGVIDHSEHLPSLTSNYEHQGNGIDNQIAIIGLSGRFSGRDIHTVWQSIAKGQGLFGRMRIPDLQSLQGEVKANDTVALLDGVDDSQQPFDLDFLRTVPRDVPKESVQQPGALMVAYEALQSAGLLHGPKIVRHIRAASFYSRTLDGQQEFISRPRTFAFDWCAELGCSSQPSFSSSADAIRLACTALQEDILDLALVGESDTDTIAQHVAKKTHGYHENLSENPWQASADSLRAATTGVLVLKRLDDALENNDCVLATIHGHLQSSAITARQVNTTADPTQLQVCGTTSNDFGDQVKNAGSSEVHRNCTRMEHVARRAAVPSLSEHRKKHDVSLHIIEGDAKPTCAASGVVSAIESVLILNAERVLPQPVPQVHAYQLWPEQHYPSSAKMEFRLLDNSITIEPCHGRFDYAIPWQANLCFVSKHNRCRYHPGPPLQTWHIITTSASTLERHRKIMAGLLEFIQHNAGDLQDLAYTTNLLSDPRHAVTNAWAVSSVEALRRCLTQECSRNHIKDVKEPPNAPCSRKVVFVFTGQGSSYAGMCKDLYNFSATFRNAIDSYRHICASFAFPDFLHVIVDDQRDHHTSLVVQTQLAIVAIELALVELWSTWGIKPDLVVGHSLGEYAALCTAGVLSTCDTLHLVGIRATLMEQMLCQSSYAMLAVGTSAANLHCQLARSDSPNCIVTCDNSPEASVCGGPVSEIQNFERWLSHHSAGLTSKMLTLKFGFHTADMDPILTTFGTICRDKQFHAPRVPVGSSLEGRVHQNGHAFDGDYLVRQCRKPVAFREAVIACNNTLPDTEHTLWLEIGPDAVCASMLRKTLGLSPQQVVPCCSRRMSCWATLTRALASMHINGHQIDWQAYYLDCSIPAKLLEISGCDFD